MVFERATNTARIRGHIGLWDTHATIGSQEVWVGSATYDIGIELVAQQICLHTT